MPDKKTVDAYKSIRAPEGLREKVLNSTEEKKKTAPVVVFRKISSMAAALAVILLASFAVFFSSGDVKVSGVNGRLTSDFSPVEQENSPAAFARISEVLSVPLNIKVSKDTEITVSAGKVSDEEGNLLSSVKEDSNMNIEWIIPDADEDISYEMTLRNPKNTYLITLSFFPQTDSWNVCIEKQ